MSIEAKIEANTAAILKLIAVLEAKQAVIQPNPVLTAQPGTPLQSSALPNLPPAIATTAAAPVVAAAPMPELPSFVAPVVAPAPVSAAPFTDSKGLISYVMEAYKAMGAEKGAKIQNVLVGLGYQNINDVKPEHYGALFAGVEALKA